MLKVTRLADYAVSIIYAFSGSEKEILSSQDIIEKTKLHKALCSLVFSIISWEDSISFSEPLNA